MRRGTSGLRTVAALAALGALAAGVQGGANPAAERVLSAQQGGQQQTGQPGNMQRGAPGLLEAMLGLRTGVGSRLASSRYIRRPFGSVARDKRNARKRRNVMRARRAGR